MLESKGRVSLSWNIQYFIHPQKYVYAGNRNYFSQKDNHYQENIEHFNRQMHQFIKSPDQIYSQHIMLKRQKLKCPLISLFVFTSCALLLEIGLLLSQPIGDFLGYSKNQATYTFCKNQLQGQAFKLYLQKSATSFSYSLVIVAFIAILIAFIILLISLIKFVKNGSSSKKEKNQNNQDGNDDAEMRSIQEQLKKYEDSFTFRKFVAVYVCCSVSICGVIIELGVFIWVALQYYFCNGDLFTSVIAIIVMSFVTFIILLAAWIILAVTRGKFHEYFDTYEILTQDLQLSDVDNEYKNQQQDTLMHLNTENDQKPLKKNKSPKKVEESKPSQQKKLRDEEQNKDENDEKVQQAQQKGVNDPNSQQNEKERERRERIKEKQLQKKKLKEQKLKEKRQKEKEKELKKEEEEREKQRKRRQQQERIEEEAQQKREEEQYKKKKTKIIKNNNPNIVNNSPAKSSPKKSKIRTSNVNNEPIRNSNVRNSPISKLKSPQSRYTQPKKVQSYKKPSPDKEIDNYETFNKKKDHLKPINKYYEPQHQTDRPTPKFQTQGAGDSNVNTPQESSRLKNNLVPSQSQPYFRSSRVKSKLNTDNDVKNSEYTPFQRYEQEDDDGNKSVFEKYFQKQSTAHHNPTHSNIPQPVNKNERSALKKSRTDSRYNDESYEKGRTEGDAPNIRNTESPSRQKPTKSRSKDSEYIRGRFEY